MTLTVTRSLKQNLHQLRKPLQSAKSKRILHHPTTLVQTRRHRLLPNPKSKLLLQRRRSRVARTVQIRTVKKFLLNLSLPSRPSPRRLNLLPKTPTVLRMKQRQFPLSLLPPSRL